MTAALTGSLWVVCSSSSCGGEWNSDVPSWGCLGPMELPGAEALGSILSMGVGRIFLSHDLDVLLSQTQ